MVLRAARRSTTAQGVGGMTTKIEAARVATASGVAVVITGGRTRPLTGLLGGEQHGTIFLPERRPPPSRHRWLALGFAARGTVIIDDGAREALRRGNSLLAAGVVDVQGTFESGEAVVIRDTRGEEVARGISRYPSVEVVHIKGSRSPEVARLLGVHAPKEIVHRDNLILSGPG